MNESATAFVNGGALVGLVLEHSSGGTLQNAHTHAHTSAPGRGCCRGGARSGRRPGGRRWRGAAPRRPSPPRPRAPAAPPGPRPSASSVQAPRQTRVWGGGGKRTWARAWACRGRAAARLVSFCLALGGDDDGARLSGGHGLEAEGAVRLADELGHRREEVRAQEPVHRHLWARHPTRATEARGVEEEEENERRRKEKK